MDRVSPPADSPSPAEPDVEMDRAVDALARALFRLQFKNVPAYRKLCESRGISPDGVNSWTEIPAVPTAAFKHFEMTSLPLAERSHVFHSSGTTEHIPSRHFHHAESLEIYEASLLRGFEPRFMTEIDPDSGERSLLDEPLGLIFLAPPPEQAPRSSLVHMFETVRRRFGSRDSFFAGKTDEAGNWTVDLDRFLFGARKSMCANRPIGILGTAFSFVNVLDHFERQNIRYRFAAGSRVLETGGYKGRSRALPKPELHGLIERRFGIGPSFIVSEYGMSELSSQAYDRTVGIPGERLFQFPPWCRAQMISPETGRPAEPGETGLIRLVDLANVRSVMALQTEDLGIWRGNGFELLGRAAAAEPRGCSLSSLETEVRR